LIDKKYLKFDVGLRYLLGGMLLLSLLRGGHLLST